VDDAVWVTVLSLLALQMSFRLPPLGYAVMMSGAPPHCGPQRAQWANTNGTVQRQRPDDEGHRTNDLGEACRQDCDRLQPGAGWPCNI
jgi:hypothetical protein